jgi:hypothetical protein
MIDAVAAAVAVAVAEDDESLVLQKNTHWSLSSLTPNQNGTICVVVVVHTGTMITTFPSFRRKADSTRWSIVSRRLVRA